MNAFTIFLTCILFALTSAAQGLPPTSRTVYKCEEGSKIHYSDSPCLGAKKIDVQPTRGLNKSSGKENIGKDVRSEHHREAIAEIVRPLTGMNSSQLYRAERRMKLTPEAQRECQRLDKEIPLAEEVERQTAQQNALAHTQEKLLRLRADFRALRCE